LDFGVLLHTILIVAIEEGTILLLAALGEVYAERSGILNLGVEGMMAIGALMAITTYLFTANYILAILIAALCGFALSMVHAVVSIHLKSNQIVSGLAITILGLGLSGFLGRQILFHGFSIAGTPIQAMKSIAIPGLSSIPIVGDAFFNQNALVYFSYVLVAILWFVLFRTRLGLNIRTVGENPAMADSLGVNVYVVRYLCTGIGGLLAGLSGALITLGYYPTWTEGMTLGRGWIAIGLVILATWSPFRALLGAYLFGAVTALPYTFQSLAIQGIPTDFLQMLPYALTLVVLTAISFRGLRKRLAPPAALGVPYSREE
jgi:simple sugar transport system permease protein